MPTLIAQARLIQATRLTLVDKKISANLTATFTTGHQTIVNGDPLVYGIGIDIKCQKVKRTIIDLDCVSTISLTPEKFLTIGFSNFTQPGYFQRGQRYQITTLGTADYNLIADTTGVTYQVGSVFTAANTGEIVPSITGVAIGGTGGQFTCTATRLVVGNKITITGTFGADGTGSITGYTTEKVYTISAITGSGSAVTGFTLTDEGTAIVTTAGTPTGLTFTAGALALTGRAMLLTNLTVSTLTCKFPTYIRIDLEALGMDSYEGQDCIMQLDEGVIIQGNYPGSEFTPNPPEASFMTFRIPKYFRSQLSSSVSSSTLVLKIKQLASSLNSAVSVSAFAQLNPGKFAALVFSLGSMNSIARKTAVGVSSLSSIVSTVINNTRARLFNSSLSSQFTMPPIDLWYRRLGVSAMSSTATISALVTRNIGPIFAFLDAAGTEQGFQFTSTARKTTSIIQNLSTSSSVNASVIATLGIPAFTLTTSSSLSVIGDVPMILTTSGTTVGLPLWYGSINAVIDWGDGTTQAVTSTPGTKTNLTHTYATAAARTIYIKGSITHWGFATAQQFADAVTNNFGTNPAGSNYVVQAFGAIGIQSLIAYSSIYGLNGFTPVSIPNTVTDISYFYYFANDVSNPSRLQSWNTSNIQKMEGVFRLTQGDLSALPITGWDTGSVTTMKRMFRNSGSTGTGANFNADISGWDVSNVQNFSEMFRDTPSFQRNLSNWDVSSGTDFSFMFSTYYGELYNWNLSSATSGAALEQMLYYGELKQDLTSWCVPNIASRPTNFAVDAYAGYALREPVWGTCAANRPIITVTTNKTTVTEGETITITITASNVSTPTVYWRINADFPTWNAPLNSAGSPNSQTGIVYSQDVSQSGTGSTGGSITLSAGTATVTLTVPQDTITEVSESFRIDVYSILIPPSPVSTGQFLLGATPTITISSNNT